jgi:hypothetical protein
VRHLCPVPGGALVQAYLVVHILAGWVLATLGIAAVSSLLRRER